MKSSEIRELVATRAENWSSASGLDFFDDVGLQNDWVGSTGKDFASRYDPDYLIRRG